MAVPNFNGFQLQDSNFITERIFFKGFANRDVILAKVNRREGVKLLGNEFGDKEVQIDGVIIASSPANLQTLVDNMKKNLLGVEGQLELEDNRSFLATVKNLVIPDEHYNQSKAPYEITFICSQPFAEGIENVALFDAVSGIITVSGSFLISGTFFNRPQITIDPAGASTGNTNINRIDIYHVNTGQTVTISGLGSNQGLNYSNTVIINYEDFLVLEGGVTKDYTGTFSKWEPGTNSVVITFSGNWVGGLIGVRNKPRYI